MRGEELRRLWGLNQNIIIPRQLSLREVIGQKEGKPRPVSSGCPRRDVDVKLLRELRGIEVTASRGLRRHMQGQPASTSAKPLCKRGWVILGTKPGTLEYNLGHIWIRRLGWSIVYSPNHILDLEDTCYANVA